MIVIVCCNYKQVIIVNESYCITTTTVYFEAMENGSLIY